MKKRPNITIDDLMDAHQVAEAFAVSRSSLRVAMNNPDQFKALAGKLPAPIGQLAGGWVWLRYDIDKALAA
jgi:hypothetical protein